MERKAWCKRTIEPDSGGTGVGGSLFICYYWLCGRFLCKQFIISDDLCCGNDPYAQRTRGAKWMGGEFGSEG